MGLVAIVKHLQNLKLSQDVSTQNIYHGCFKILILKLEA